MTNPTGYIISMNFPNKYDNNANCRWDLTAPNDQVVMLEFVDEFHLEGTNRNCKLDYVEVIKLPKFCCRCLPDRVI